MRGRLNSGSLGLMLLLIEAAETLAVDASRPPWAFHWVQSWTSHTHKSFFFLYSKKHQNKLSVFFSGSEKLCWLCTDLWTKHATVSHIFSLLLSSLVFYLFIFLPAASPSPYVCLSPCLSLSLLSCSSPFAASGPQNKDSIESLNSDGDEKEVRTVWKHCGFVTQPLNHL